MAAPRWFRPGWRVALGGAAVGLAIAWIGACRSGRGAEAPGAVATREPALAKAARFGGGATVVVPSLVAGPPDHATPLSSDSLWSRAAARAPIDLDRLANREGASGLLDGFDAGGTLALTALAALPDADDAPLSLRRLCTVLAHAEPSSLAPVLVAVQAIASAVPGPTEQVDPEGEASCRPVLAALEKTAALSPHERDLAASARAMLDERLSAH